MKPIKETIEKILASINPNEKPVEQPNELPTFKARLKDDFFTIKKGELIEVKPLEPENNRNAFLIIYPIGLLPTRRMITAYHLDFIE